MGDYEDEYGWEKELDDYPEYVKCKYCEKNDLQWVRYDNKYKLVELSGEIHHCIK